MRDIVDEGDDHYGNNNDDGLLAGDETSCPKWMTDGDVAFYGDGYCYPHITLLQRHDDVISWCVDNWIDMLLKVF